VRSPAGKTRERGGEKRGKKGEKEDPKRHFTYPRKELRNSAEKRRSQESTNLTLSQSLHHQGTTEKTK